MKYRQPDRTTTFYETQRFNQPWLWILLILTAILMVGVCSYGLILQLVYGQPWGNRPLSDTALLIVGCIAILFNIGILYLFYSLRLITIVSADGLYVRFYPLVTRTIPFYTIRSSEAREYNSLFEFGGWGIRYRRGGWVYSVTGYSGVQIVLVNGKQLLIGSQRAVELETAIKEHCGI